MRHWQYFIEILYHYEKLFLKCYILYHQEVPVIKFCLFLFYLPVFKFNFYDNYGYQNIIIQKIGLPCRFSYYSTRLVNFPLTCMLGILKISILIIYQQ